MQLIRELAERYDFDGLELDWMRFGLHFRPGHEAEGAALLTEFTAEVRSVLNEWQRKRGHRIRLGARVPSRPETALGLGMDAVTWGRQGLVDMLVRLRSCSSNRKFPWNTGDGCYRTRECSCPRVWK